MIFSLRTWTVELGLWIEGRLLLRCPKGSLEALLCSERPPMRVCSLLALTMDFLSFWGELYMLLDETDGETLELLMLVLARAELRITLALMDWV